VAATRDKYLPPQVAERWLKPYTTCSIVSYLVGIICTTMGEMTTWSNGKPYGDKALKALVNKGWLAVDPEKDDPGFGLSDFNTLAKTWGSPLRADDVEFVRERSDIVAALQANNVITMAGNVSGVPDPTPLDDHVGGADHRMAFLGHRIYKGVQQTRFFDPMTLDDHANWGRWVPINDMFAFGRKFKKDNKFLAEKFRTGSQTREAIARRNGAKSVLQVQQRVVDLQAELIEANETIARKQLALDVCKETLDSGVNRTEALLLIAEIEAELSAAQDALLDLKANVSVSPLR
jgi:hypothetical protein